MSMAAHTHRYARAHAHTHIYLSAHTHTHTRTHTHTHTHPLSLSLSLTHAHFVFRISLCRQEDPGCVVYNAPSSIIHFQTDDHTLSRSQCSGVSRKRACGAADVMLELPRDAVRAWLTFRMYTSSRICVGRNSQPNPEAPTFLSSTEANISFYKNRPA